MVTRDKSALSLVDLCAPTTRRIDHPFREPFVTPWVFVSAYTSVAPICTCFPKADPIDRALGAQAGLVHS